MKFLIVFLTVAFATAVFGADLDIIGVTLLRQVDPTLQGNGVPVAQAEAPDGALGAFEVNPLIVGQPTNLFTWISSSGTATNYPNAVGTQSIHGNSVAGNFYSPSFGVAPQVSHVDNYDAEFFWTNVVLGGTIIQARVVNQSFIFSDTNNLHVSTNEERQIDSAYDDYAAQNKVLFVSGAGNGGRVYPAATCYNGLGVGVYPGSSSVGPTTEGRGKPDIVSPGSSATSFSTPFVSGSAAVLLQAGLRGDGGVKTNDASDIRTVKTLLLNGAIKPADWTNSITTPLDFHYGAGVLNVFNSWQQLKGGEHPPIESTSNTNSDPHPPGPTASNEPVLTGWDFNSITNSDSSHDRVNHYYFNLPGNVPFTLTATLVWNRQAGETNINDLNLFLYNTANSNLVLSSTSAVDNVEHIFIRSLPPGRYDLQVQKSGTSPEVSTNETYALAFEFFNLSLQIMQTNNTAVITWPLAPTGFALESTTTLTPPVSWTPVAAPVSIDTNANQNVVSVPITSTNQFFRLRRP